MKITGGTLRGRNIKISDGSSIRPTSSRVREALFNMLMHLPAPNGQTSCLIGQPVADLCCGSGLLGIEALSRCAASVLFVDQSPASLSLAKSNAAALNITDQCSFLAGDILKLPPSRQQVALVLADPPYGKNLLTPLLTALIEKNWLLPNAVIAAELEATASADIPVTMQTLKEKSYGKTKLLVLRANN